MVYCNKCKHEFEVKVRTKHIEKDVEEIFFNCPNCHERYTSYYLNDKIKQLQERLIFWSRRNGKADTSIQLQKDMETEMNNLELLYGAP